MSLADAIRILNEKVPPASPFGNQREPLQATAGKGFPEVPPVLPENLNVQSEGSELPGCGQAGDDLQAANEIAPLPSRLVVAATRACREHGDDDKAIAAMLDDLRAQPDAWNDLIDHFEQQLPPPPQPGHERRRMQAAGYEFDIDVPVRTSVRFELRDGQGGGVFAGTGLTLEQRRQRIIAMYGSRLATIDGLRVRV